MSVPRGSLLEHVQPADISGLTSDGWDRQIYIGAFMIVSVDLWFEAEVQDFLALVLAVGSDVRMRWQEQVTPFTSLPLSSLLFPSLLSSPLLFFCCNLFVVSVLLIALISYCCNRVSST